ncbi:MAG: hypothetical protein KBH99_06585 [Syntrophobacteraceae bacterium]|nr:hypothetical protein [Syntrophobacteraceae bacterium]
MASKTQHTKLVRKRKHSPNKTNTKANQARILRNLQVLAKATSGGS